MDVNERRHIAQLHRRQPGNPHRRRSHRQLQFPMVRTVINIIHGASLGEKAGGEEAMALGHVQSPRHERVVDNAIHGRIGVFVLFDEVVVDAVGLEETGGVAAVGNGVDGDGVGDGFHGVGNEGGDGHSGFETFGDEAFAELKHGIDVALAWIRNSKNMCSLFSLHFLALSLTNY
nr:hypothetical protein Iba_scaffold8048CG0010 [Ipomoea batatas]